MPLTNLRKLWGSSKQKTTSEAESDYERTIERGADSKPAGPQLPLLQVWPSQDSPEKMSSTGQHFIFHCEDISNIQQNDSGIDSVQASPSPRPNQCNRSADELSPTPSNKSRRTSYSFLHPNHARFIKTFSPNEQNLIEETTDCTNPGSGSSSTASSMASITGAVPHLGARHSDPWERRRSSVMTRYSLFDALDLEYALLHAATRSSIGQSSLSHSIHKLTFTQSLAFPALAKGLAGKRRPSHIRASSRPDPTETGLNAIAKIITVIVLFVVSLMIFGIVFKYVRT